MSGPRRPAIASDDWMLEQQLRAEMEAEAWRRLRYELAAPVVEAASVPPAPPIAAEPDYHSGGSLVLKALVRFALASFGAYLAWIAAMDAGLGGFEVWLTAGSAFVVVLALSLLGPARRMVHMLAETARWLIIIALALGALWILLQGRF